MARFSYILFLVCISLIVACSSGSEAESAMPASSTSRAIAANTASDESEANEVLPKLFGKRLELAWVAEGGLNTPESIVYYPEGEILFVSNIGGYPGLKNKNGFISRVDVNSGEVLTPYWFTDLNSPQGMALHDGVLYVADVDELVAINIQTASLIQKYPAQDSVLFLNDVVVDNTDRVYVSDSRAQSIFRLHANKLDLWLKDEMIFIPNGMFLEGNNLLIGVDSKVLSVDMESKNIEVYINTGMGRVTDGLVSDTEGGYFSSDWDGSAYLIHPERNPVKILDGSIEGINAADLEYIPELNLLLIPTFRDNRVLAYTWNPDAS